MTEALFRDDAYLKSCTATVTAVSGAGVVLDRTVFYPLGGGQPGDTGELQRAVGLETLDRLGGRELEEQRHDLHQAADHRGQQGQSDQPGDVAFRALLPRVIALAVIGGNLERLRDDYARTARRARAMEDVLLPEIDQTLGAIQSALEELDREESLRARFRATSD